MKTKIKRALRVLLTIFASALAVIFIFPFLYLMELIRPVRIGILYYDRIGHLSLNSEIFCRRVELGLLPRHYFYAFFSAEPVNKQLYKMYKRVLRIWDNRTLFRLATFFFPILTKSRFYQNLPSDCNEYYEFYEGKSCISFTPEEEEFGQAQLRKMGIGPQDWFVLIHARDPLYMKEKIFSHQDVDKQARNYEYNYRDCQIENYLLAAEYITSQGGFVIRMGEVVSSPLNTKNPKIIDYATHFRSDFLDIYLPAKCKFFLGCTSGLCMIPTIFDVPVALANYIPYPHTPFSIQDLFITKFIRDLKTGKILSYRQAAQQGLMGWVDSTTFYKSRQLELLENTPEDILALCREMNEELDKKGARNKQNVPHTELQVRYKEEFLPLLHGNLPQNKLAARLAQSFMDAHPFLME